MRIWRSDGQQPEKCPVDSKHQCFHVVMKANYTLVSAGNKLKELIILLF